MPETLSMTTILLEAKTAQQRSLQVHSSPGRSGVFSLLQDVLFPHLRSNSSCLVPISFWIPSSVILSAQWLFLFSSALPTELTQTLNASKLFGDSSLDQLLGDAGQQSRSSLLKEGQSPIQTAPGKFLLFTLQPHRMLTISFGLKCLRWNSNIPFP